MRKQPMAERSHRLQGGGYNCLLKGGTLKQLDKVGGVWIQKLATGTKGGTRGDLLDGGVEAKGVLHEGDVIVDGLRDPHHRDVRGTGPF